MPPVVGLVNRQDAAQEVVDEAAKLLVRVPRPIVLGLLRLGTAAVCIKHRLDVELLLVPEMVVDRRDVRPRPITDRANPRAFESLLGKLLTSRLQQPNLRRVLNF